MNPVKAVVLDIGGVVLQLDWNRMLLNLGLSPDQLQDLFHYLDTDTDFLSFECGKISQLDFFRSFQNHFGLKQEWETFKKAWESLILGPIEGVEETLKQLARSIPLYALSNTNEIHYALMMNLECMKSFREVFASQLLFQRKPNAEIYVTLCEKLNLSPSEILFVDDTQPNIDGALKVGLQAYRAWNSNSELRGILGQFHLL